MSRADQNAVIRGCILQMLSYQGDALTDVLIHHTLAGMEFDLPLGEVRTQLRYLEQKGYVTLATKDLPRPRWAQAAHSPGAKGGDIIVASLTAKGTDFLEGRLEDVGIEVPDWSRGGA